MQLQMFSSLPYDDTEETKQCKVCKEVKPIVGFHIQCYKKDNIPSYSKVCKSCKEKQRQTRDTLKAIASPMPDRCDCCGAEEALLLDHCHKTLKFRGWICNGCNVGIGHLGDTVEGLNNAVEYLKKHYG